MDAGIPSDASQQPIDYDDGAGLTLGSGVQVQIDGDEGDQVQFSDPDFVFPDDGQSNPTIDFPFPAPIITGSPITVPSAVPELWSESVEPFYISPLDSSWTETPYLPAPALTTLLASVIFTLNQPLAFSSISFPTSLSDEGSIISSTNLPAVTLIPSSRISITLPSSITPSPQLASTASISPSASSLSSVLSNSASLFTSGSSGLRRSSSVPVPSSSASQAISQHLPSETVVAPPMPANLNVHPATFYVGIGVGTVVAIALLVALIAWWIRWKTRRKRKRSETTVPWGRSDNYDDGTLESGDQVSEMEATAFAAQNLGSREDLAHIQAWSSFGDRDVGEPRRAQPYTSAPQYGAYPYSRSRHSLYPDNMAGYGYPYAEYDRSLSPRQLPSHLIAGDVSPRVYQPCQNDYSANSSKRARSEMEVVNGDHREPSPLSQEIFLQVPHPPPRSMSDRLCSLGRHSDSGSETNSERLPTPNGPKLGNGELEEWSSSLRTSLVKAFNAVASNLGASAPRLKEDDVLSAPPMCSIRRSRHSGFGEKLDDDTGTYTHGCESNSGSQSWTLEETSEGAGVVHLHLPELEKEFTAQRPLMHGPTLSFGDGEDIVTSNDVKARSEDHKATELQIALFASSKPKRAFIRPETYFARQKSTETVNRNSVSRSNSIYSTNSVRTDSQPRGGASELFPAPSMSNKPHAKGSRDHEDVDSVVIAPDAISLLSSFDSSVLTLSSDASLSASRSSTDVAASRALKERLKRAG